MLQRRLFLWSIILLVGAFTLTGCGGGDDNGAPAPTGAVTKFAILDGTQAGVTTTANGTGSLTVDRGTGAVNGFLAIQSAPPTAPTRAHVHLGARGTSGGVVIELANSGGGVWSVPAGETLTADEVGSFDGGNLYFAMHTDTGEPATGLIRGQIDQTSITLYARLDGVQEVPLAGDPDPVNTTATATGSLTVVADTGAVTGGSLTIGTPPATAIGQAHVHQGDREANGSIVIPLEGTAGTTTGTWSVPAGTVLNQANRDLFIRGDLYFNVHTGAFGAGEIRGQIDLIAP